MMNYRKYKRQYFMPPEDCYDWVKKEYIEKAPVWCSVDLRDGNQALVIPHESGSEGGLSLNFWWISDLRRSRWASRLRPIRNIFSCGR